MKRSQLHLLPMEYHECQPHVKLALCSESQEDWMDGGCPCGSGKATAPGRGPRRMPPRYYQHHAALTLTLTTITVLLSLHLVLLGDAVSAAVELNPQQPEQKILLPTLDGKNSISVLSETQILGCTTCNLLSHQLAFFEVLTQKGYLRLRRSCLSATMAWTRTYVTGFCDRRVTISVKDARFLCCVLVSRTMSR